MNLKASFLYQALGDVSCLYYTAQGKQHAFSLAQLSQYVPLSFQEHECSLAIDSRLVRNGDVFLAYQGERVDGHTFISDALTIGARALIIDEKKIALLSSLAPHLLENKLIIIVPDTFKALTTLAAVYRSYFSYPIIGITGSLGKTTTKEMVRSIIHAAGIKAYVSYKNQNSLFGASINILNLNGTYQCAVLEMGVSTPNEMDQLVDIVRPTSAAVTTISPVHSEFLGSLENIAVEKLKILKYCSPNASIVLGDHPLLHNHTYTQKIVRCGIKTKNDIYARAIIYEGSNEASGAWYEGGMQLRFSLCIKGEKHLARLHTESKASVHNALIAAGIAHALGIDIKTIVAGLEAFRPVDGRFKKEYLPHYDCLIINDCYNANPDSMKNALHAFECMKGADYKIALLGEMRELGERQKFYHKALGREIGKLSGLDRLILVGEQTKHSVLAAPATMRIDWYPSWEGAYEQLLQCLKKRSLVLLKGSLGVGLGNVVERLRVKQ